MPAVSSHPKRSSIPNLHTVPSLAKLFGVRPYQVEYVVGNHDVEPSAIIGGSRVFDSETAERIGKILQSIRTKRGVARA